MAERQADDESSASGCSFAESELLHTVDEGLSADIQVLRRMGLVPVELFRARTMSSFSTPSRLMPCGGRSKWNSRPGRSAAEKSGKIIQGDVVAAREHHEAFDHVLQFPDVARPPIGAEIRQQRRWQEPGPAGLVSPSP